MRLPRNGDHKGKAHTRARRTGELASFETLRLLDRRPVETGRCRVLGAVTPSFAALQLQVELASQPEQQSATSTAGSSTTTTRVPQTATWSARSPRLGARRV
jgi:hypothetical protein